VRLRPLSEDECYARCYGGRREEAVTFLPELPSSDPATGRRTAYEVFEQLTDGRLFELPATKEAA